MFCKYNPHLIKLNEQREKKGLQPLSRRQFCKLAAGTSVAFLSMPLFFGCEGDDGVSGPDYIVRTLGQDSRAEIEIRPDVELDDYSGPFRPDLRYTDFSQKGLSNLTQMANDYHNTIQNRYRQYVYDNHGHAGVIEAEEAIWGTMMVGGIHKMITETMKIDGSDLEAFMKQWQLEFDMIPSAHYDVVFEMPSEDRGIVTINRCTVAEQYEAAGRTDELPDVCMAKCGNYIRNAAKKYDEGIVIKNLTMPPRPEENSEDYVYCKWEVYYETDDSLYPEGPVLIDPLKMDKRGVLDARPGYNLEPLEDYRGPFDPDLRMADFSREQLARMYLMYHQYDLDLIQCYQTWELGKVGWSEMTEMHVDVWSTDLAYAAYSIMKKYLNTSGSGIDSFLKAVQVDITAQPPNFDQKFEMPDENSGILTFNTCYGITNMEAIGGTDEQIEELCALDPPAIGNSCDMWYSQGLEGKTIKLDIITMPPRRYDDEICCQWKFTYV